MNLPPFLKSRKFWALIAGALVIIIRQLVPALPVDDAKLSELILLLVAYIIGTGLEDTARAKFQPPQVLPLNVKGPQPK